MIKAKGLRAAAVAPLILAATLALILHRAEVVPLAMEADRASAAGIPSDDFKPGEILVQFKEGLPAANLSAALAAQGLEVKWHLPRFGIALLAVPEGHELATAAVLRSDPQVAYAGPNYRLYAPEPEVRPLPKTPALVARAAGQVTPNDPLYANYQWNLNNTGQQDGVPDADIDAPEAWEITTGSSEVIIAVLDSGIDRGHPDMAGKLWTNPDEIPGNGLDDDGNKKVDDIYGWDFVWWDNEPQNEPGGLGTAVAGIAAAATDNGEGIAGISWGARIMTVKVLENRAGWISDVILGIQYAADEGARVINMSFVTPRDDPIFEWAIRVVHQHYGVLFAAMAGDCANGCTIGGQELVNPILYPAAFEYVIAVGATNQRDERLGERLDKRLTASEWGYYLDLMAPGQGIPAPWCCWSSSYDDSLPYALLTSTAVASPHVAGLAALIWSMYPDLSPGEVEDLMKASADKVGQQPYDASGRNDFYGYGRISGDPIVLEPPALTFVADDETDPGCRTVVNRGISALTWQATATAPWLQVDGPSNGTPSRIDVCVIRENLPGYGFHSTVITATSTLTPTVNNPRLLPVSLSYRPSLFRAFLYHIFKSYPSATP